MKTLAIGFIYSRFTYRCVTNPVHYHPLPAGLDPTVLWMGDRHSSKEAKGCNLWPQRPEYLLRQGEEGLLAKQLPGGLRYKCNLRYIS